MGDETINNNVTENNNKKEDEVSLTDSESSYVIEEEIVEYEITDSDEDKSMNTKKSSKASQKNNEKSEQNSFYETALKMKDEEMKNDGAIINIDNENKELQDGNVTGENAIDSENKNDPTKLSFKNVSDSMENIKVRLSTTHLDSSYDKINLNKTDNEFMRDIKRMRYIVSRINESHNILKKSLYEMKGNPFSIRDDEPYPDLASECNTESVADVNVDFCEDDMFNIDEAEVFEKYILCIDENNRDVFADHYENLYNMNELFKKTIFTTMSSSLQSLENNKQVSENVAAA
ncbi:hypothetical protein BCR36DRAFT_352371 [Piromyces finnis]|uniref:Uncharacterized protein n=1 Tax=Piromyces finnis TaxID=1754191 RepID=A0A1Y1V952_9FUNG|nr:hypothetical protein BCR36DRAFT_352371 [Piromyces finnis]|eukprot:ORX50318.1 hypothetical protein BCR36DRAFT_352371 [Piromyces finnis]